MSIENVQSLDASPLEQGRSSGDAITQIRPGQARLVVCWMQEKDDMGAAYALTYSHTHIHPPSIHPYNTRSRAEQAPPAVAAPVSPTERPSTVVTQAPGCASRAFSNFALLCYTTLPRAMCEYTVCIHSTEWRCLLRLYCMCSTRAPLVCRTL